MIINFSVKNFGSFKEEQTLSFEAEKSTHLEDFYVTKVKNLRLLKIALIYGANASGKTMLLKALDFLRDLVLNPVNKKTELLDFQPFLFDQNTSKENTVLSIEFIHNDIKYFYQVQFNRKAIVSETLKYFSPKKATVFNRETDLDKQFTTIKFGRKIKVPKASLNALEANTLWNNTVLGGYLKTNIEIKELKEVVDWFENYLEPVIYPWMELSKFIAFLIDSNLIEKHSLLRILKKADLNISDVFFEKKEMKIPEVLIDFLEDFSFIPKHKLKVIKNENTFTNFDFDLIFKHTIDGNDYNLPFNIESAGTQRYFGFAGILTLLIKNPKIFPIDELGASLHPDLYQHFLLTFLANAKNSQIIATTHNREILADKDLIRDDALWITNKTKEGATELYSFADFDSSIIRDTTNRLNAYKSGKLGGIPNLGDYYLDLD